MVGNFWRYGMAKQDINEQVKFYRIAIADNEYEYISSLSIEARRILQAAMQKLLAHELVGLRELGKAWGKCDKG